MDETISKKQTDEFTAALDKTQADLAKLPADDLAAILTTVIAYLRIRYPQAIYEILAFFEVAKAERARKDAQRP